MAMDDRKRARARRRQRGDDNAQIRKLKSIIDGLYEVIETQQRKTSEAKGLADRSEKIAADLSVKLAQASARRGIAAPASEPELLALAAAALLDVTVPTPQRNAMRDRLVDELTYRGILPPTEGS